MKKDVVYIDNDDEIASITDKVQSSGDKIVALVLPKRCTVLQSSVNMKILNKAANDAGKQVVLITSEAGLLPLAGASGLFVAKTLQSKPAVPGAPQVDDAVESVVEADVDPEAELDPNKSIGELDGDTEIDEDAPIELGDDPVDDSKKAKEPKEKKDKKLAVPNFDSFRAKLFIFAGIGAVLLILGYFAFFVLPKATVLVKIQYKTVPVTLTVTGSSTATTTDTSAGTVPLATKKIEKAETKKFAATGQKNNGTKASGTMTITNCTDNTLTAPAGTRFTNNGFSFATDVAATVPGSNFKSNGDCKEDGKVSGISVTAVQGGQSYNLSAGRVYASSLGSAVFGTGSAMGGGTDKTVKIVSSEDCEAAKNELLNANTDTYKTQLEAELKSAGSTPLPETFTKTVGSSACSPAVGEEAAESTATAQLTFTMAGVSTEGMNQLIAQQVNKEIDESTEKIYENGLEAGTFTIKEKQSNGDVVFEFTGDAKVGVKQDPTVVANAVAGKKYGESVSAVKGLTGVSDVTITYSPFYVKSTPKNVNKITVKFEIDNAGQ